MQVKVFESKDMASGLKMVKKELGPEALIISTRTVRNGKLGLLGKPTLEITAAIDTSIVVEEACLERHYTEPQDTFQLKSTKQMAGFSHTVDQPLDHLLQHHPVDSETFPMNFSFTPSVNTNTTDSCLADEVSELKNLVKSLSGDISRLHKNDKIFASSPPIRQTKNSTFHNPDCTNSQEQEILSMLTDKGINDLTSRKITGFLYEKLTGDELSNPEIVFSTIISTIQNFLHVAPPLFGIAGDQQRIALIGPTGVGKTTTLAKIAASYLTAHSHSIALITIDTYRIAAVEQLKVYGEIMHLPVDVVITPDQLKRAIEKHQDKDLILIDTAGRSPRDTFCIAELTTFLSPELNIDKHLVLSATTREVELLNTIERFNSLGISNTIFTKIDECSNLGVLLNIMIQNDNPLSYVTNGQRVPEDLVEISENRVAELIMSQHEGHLHD